MQRLHVHGPLLTGAEADTAGGDLAGTKVNALVIGFDAGAAGFQASPSIVNVNADGSIGRLSASSFARLVESESAGALTSRKNVKNGRVSFATARAVSFALRKMDERSADLRFLGEVRTAEGGE
jgi:hypothetical protein